MGYIEVGDDLTVYSVTDDLIKLFDWGIYLLRNLSPLYYFLLGMGLTIFLILGIALKVGALGKKYYDETTRGSR